MSEPTVTISAAVARELLGTIEVSVRAYGTAAAQVLIPIKLDIEAQLAQPPKPAEP